MINSKKSITLLLLTFLMPIIASAQSYVTPLKNGMSYKEVQEIWGIPKNKEEFEALREDRWTYEKSMVVFKNGKVKSWEVLPGHEILGESLELPKENLNPKNISVDEILNEMINPSN